MTWVKKLTGFAHLVRTTPFADLPGECVHAARQRWRCFCERMKDRWVPTGLAASPVCGPLARYLSLPRRDSLLILRAQIDLVSQRLLDHRFNLLGSGLIAVPASTDLEATVNSANLLMSRDVAGHISPGFVSIDWHVDFRSGQRWNSRSSSSLLRYGDRLGADIKVPWELARSQHLPTLALAYALAASEVDTQAKARQYAVEIESQILDFISRNPPRFGVNWVCSMDVAIRAANWLIALDLLAAAGWVGSEAFHERLVASLFDHGRHIVSHLEWHPRFRGNHYLANIAGLVFLGSFLPCSPETDDWLRFGIRELVSEVRYQFHGDGSNFEASTSYHRFSAEMVVYATAMVLALTEERVGRLRSSTKAVPRFRPGTATEPENWTWSEDFRRETPFPPWYFSRLREMRRFSEATTLSDGRVFQFGDNDSGRFVRLGSLCAATDGEAREAGDILDHRHVTDAIAGLFGDERSSASKTSSFDCEIVCGLVRNSHEASPVRMHVERDSPGRFAAFPDFGLWVYQSSAFQLAIRCGSVGQNGNGGHAHNDQLSFELAAYGIPFIVDTGTYVYTPFPEERNWFRSTAQHNTLGVTGWEQNTWLPGAVGLFSLRDVAKVRVVKAEPAEFEGECARAGVSHQRRLSVGEKRIDGFDTCEHRGDKFVSFHFDPNVVVEVTKSGVTVRARRGEHALTLGCEQAKWSLEPTRISEGYGIVKNSTVARLRFDQPTVHWWIESEGTP